MKTFSLVFRKLKKSKTATSLGIAGLVTGLVCVLFIFFWVNDEISYNRVHKNIDRIFVVHAYLEGGTTEVNFSGCPPAVAPAIKAEYPEVESTCRFIPAYNKRLITADGKNVMLDIAISDNSLFDIFTLPFIYGNQGTPKVPNQIVLTQRAAAGIFGNANPVGKIVRYENQKDLTVVGVIKDIPNNSSIRFDGVIPIENIATNYGRSDYLTTWYNNAFRTFGLLSQSSGFEKLESTITRRIQKEMPESTNYLRAYLFKNEYLYEQQHIRSVRMFSLIAILVLIAATLNFINLITARSNKQGKETGLRKTIGATRGNIIKLIYSEVAILCFLAFVLALLLTIIGLPFFNQFVGKQIEISALFTFKPLLILVLAYLVTTILAGSYPAFFLSSFKVTETLNSNFFSVKSKGIFRNSLLVAIFMISIILLTSTLIISKQTLYLQNMDIGFNKDQLIYISLDGQLKGKARSIKEEVGRTIGISSSTITSYLPVMIGENGEGWSWDGKAPEFKPLVTRWYADEDMLETLESKLIEGDYFSADRQGIVINKAFANAIGWENSVGKILTDYGNSYKVVGVINNIEYNSLSESCRPMAILPVEERSSNYLIAKVNAGQMDNAIKTIMKICQAIEPNYPVNYGFVDNQYAQLYETETKLKKLVGVFSAFSMIVLCLGLLGVVMFLSEQKTKEIGVRKCLGERESSIIVRFVKPFIYTGVGASLIAIPATWYIMNIWLESYANRIELNMWTFLLSVMIAIGIALVTVIWQSYKTATRNPVEALRYE